MSKSLGNIISLEDILQRYDGEVVRYVLLSAAYQKTLDWTDQLVFQSKQALKRLYGALRLCDEESAAQSADPDSRLIDALCGNLNTPLALRVLHEIADQIRGSSVRAERNSLGARLRGSAAMLGLLTADGVESAKCGCGISEEEIAELIEERRRAKSAKNFKLADEIREKLLKNNIRLEDTPDGTTRHAF
jgi:cysteinyl-tRNA synthetase